MPNDTVPLASLPDWLSQTGRLPLASLMPSDALAAQDARDAAAQRMIRATAPGERQEGPITQWAVGKGQQIADIPGTLWHEATTDPMGFAAGMIGPGEIGGLPLLSMASRAGMEAARKVVPLSEGIKEAAAKDVYDSNLRGGLRDLLWGDKAVAARQKATQDWFENIAKTPKGYHWENGQLTKDVPVAPEESMPTWLDILRGRRNEPLQRDVIERGRSGRPIATELLPIGKENAILEEGARRVNESRDAPVPTGESYVVAKVDRGKPVIISAHPDQESAIAAHDALMQREWNRFARVNGLEAAYPGREEAAGQMYDKYKPGPQIVKIPGQGGHVVASSAYDEPNALWQLRMHGAYGTPEEAQSAAEQAARENWGRYGETFLNNEDRHEGSSGWRQAMTDAGFDPGHISNFSAPWPGQKQASRFWKDIGLGELSPVVKELKLPISTLSEKR